MLRKCKCGKFKTHGHRWRVIIRGEKSLLKCLTCNNRWKSRCKYVDRLADHKERSRSGMTDQEILERLKAGSLLVDHQGQFVLSLFPKKKLLAIWERERKGTVYRFTQICHGGKKKKIAIHRLVWMSRHSRTVPEGYDIDHIKDRNVEFPDGIDNLRLMPMN